MLSIGISLFAQTDPPVFGFVDTASQVQFKIKNLGFNVTGSFSGLQGTIRFDPADPAAGGEVDVSVDAGSVNTGIDMRDNHLREAGYLDVKDFPRLRFVSTKIKGSNKKGTFFIFGNLTIKGVTKAISFPFTVTPQDDGYIFDGAFKINRRDFGVGGGSTISNELTVSLHVKARKQ